MNYPTARAATRIELENGISFSINEDSLPLSIGRDSSCDIRIPSGHVSRHHCELFLQDGRLCLKDTSSNGTIVDNRLIKQSAVTIDRRTRISLADEVTMTVSPAADIPVRASGNGRAATPSADEPGQDRRQGNDRRQHSIVVAFERRSSDRARRSEDRSSE